MRAYVRTDPRTRDVVMAEVPIPAVGTNEIRIQVAAFGVGIHDRYYIPPGGPFPYVVGTEAAGVVAETRDRTEGIEVGDRVMATAAMQPKGGTWAESVVVGASAAISIPEDLDLLTASGVPIAGRTAVEALHTLDLQSGSTLFVAGASGAIGTLVVQMAALGGVRVIGSASTPNHSYLQELGAEATVDYRDPGWPEAVVAWAPGGVDAALAIQPGTGASSQQVIRPGGHVVTVSGDSASRRADVRVEQFAHRADVRHDMSALVADIARGRVRLVLDRVYPFKDAVAALEKTETRHARGKVVVSVTEPTEAGVE